MTIPTYPSSPALTYKPIPGTWSMVPGVPPLQTDLGGGNTRRRQLPGSDVKIISQKVRMTLDEITTLKAFVDADLSYGTSRFTMSVWTGASYESKTVQFLDDFPHYSDESIITAIVDMKLKVYSL